MKSKEKNWIDELQEIDLITLGLLVLVGVTTLVFNKEYDGSGDVSFLLFASLLLFIIYLGFKEVSDSIKELKK